MASRPGCQPLHQLIEGFEEYDALGKLRKRATCQKEDAQPIGYRVGGGDSDLGLFIGRSRLGFRFSFPRAGMQVSASDRNSSIRFEDFISLAAFWAPERTILHSAWLEHAPFAFWLVEALHPRILVELGTQSGFSYFSFCQAVQRLQLQAACYAVDTWKGDEQAGFYGEDVFVDVRKHNEQHFSAFSTLIRATFDDASQYFIDETIDLLHIDGRHFYDDVKRDYETWRGKLSKRALVLFHDINVRERGFGVFRLWNDLRQAHPHFEFTHGHGLGVLGVGSDVPEQIRNLFAASADAGAAFDIQQAYGRLGVAVRFQAKSKCADLAEAQASGLQSALCEREAAVAALDQPLAQRSNEIDTLRRSLSERDATLFSAQADLAQARIECERAIASLAAMRNSTSWRLTSPLRKLRLGARKFGL